jgi:Uma2 family endonuclease
MPTNSHQAMLLAFYDALKDFVRPRKLGRVKVAALPVRTSKGEYREPDVLFMLEEHAHRIGEQYWDGADLVTEVVSPGKENRDRDLRNKRREYARARIREYWIIDPENERILVLRLSKGKYVTHGEYGRGETAQSALLEGFEIRVDDVLDAD